MSEPNPAPAPEPKPAPVPSPTPSPSPSPEPGPEPVAATWPDDWRDRFVKSAPAAEREKLQKRLDRFQSPDNVLRSYLEFERRASAGLLKPALGENASPEEVTAYRKAHGIPEAATVESYGIQFPQGYTPNDADKADVVEFVADMHKDNVPPAVVQKVWAKYLGIKEKAEQQLYEAAQQQTVNNKAELKAEYGRDFDKNMRLGNAHLIEAVGEDRAKAFMALTLADGTKLGDHPDFGRYIVSQALANADDAALATSEFGSDTGAIEDQYKKALDLKFTDPKTYHSDAHQAKLQKLAAARVNGKKAAA